MKPVSYLLCVVFLFGINRSLAQNIYTIAGNGTPGFLGEGTPATAAELSDPFDVKVDAMGRVYIADESNNRIRRVTIAGIISTFAGNGTGAYAGDGGGAAAAEINNPFAIAAAGTSIYIADAANNRVRLVNGLGTISTAAGNGTSGYIGDDVPATSTRLNEPAGVARDIIGNIYISDYLNNRVRKVDPMGIITTFAGTGTAGYSGDGTAATGAQLDNPWGVAVDIYGNVFVADGANYCIRKIDTNGIISTYAGTGVVFGFTGDGGPATNAKLNYPSGIAADGAGNLFIADKANHCVRKVNSAGMISTVAGIGTSAGFIGDGGPATAAKLDGPIGVGVDGQGNLYIADRINQRVRKVINPVAPVTGNNALCVGDTALMADATPGGTWSSTNPAVATVSTSGVVTALAPGGPVSIIYSVGNESAWRIINVRPIPTLTSTLTPPDICTTDPFSYMPMSSLPGTSFVWSRAAVTGISNAAAVGMGNPHETLANTSGTPVTVTYTYVLLAGGGPGGGCRDTQNVNVVVDPSPSAGTITGPDIVCEGITITLVDGVAGGTWSSSNANVTVSGGVVTGVTAGAGAIIYTFTNACGTATTTFPLVIDPISDCHVHVPASAIKTASLNLFPNPNYGTFTINLSSPLTEKVTVVITNTVGEKVTELSAITNQPMEIKLNGNHGLFFVHAATSNGTLSGKMVIAN